LLRVAPGCRRLLLEWQISSHVTLCVICRKESGGASPVELPSQRVSPHHVRAVCPKCRGKFTKRQFFKHLRECQGSKDADLEEAPAECSSDAMQLTRAKSSHTGPFERDYDEFNLTTPNTPLYRKKRR
jgi:hypothetical protein